MIRRSKSAPVLASLLVTPALALATGCQAIQWSDGARSPAFQAVEFEREDWSFGTATGSVLTSDHYTIRTTCKSKPFVEALPGFLESCWLAYAELLPPEQEPDHQLETYLFQTRWQWEQFTEGFSPERAPIYKRIRSGGYSERGITVSHYSGRRPTLSILAHEGLHQYLEAVRGLNIPGWLNEGLACYFEAFDLDPKTYRPVFTPQANYLRTRSLRDAVVRDALIPLREILSTHAGVQVQKRPSHVRSYYAQEWSLVLFLMRLEGENPYRDGFLALLQDLGTDAMDRRARAFLAADTDGHMSYGEAVFRAYVTDDLDTFEEHYKAYLLELLHLES